MKLWFYPRLAWDSIGKNKRLYIPYILTCAGVIMMFYIIHHLAAMPALDGMSGGSTSKMALRFGVWVIAVFALIFLTYTNSFLMGRRQKEFGLYNILGMGKANLSRVYLWETLIVYVISMSTGLICGIGLSKMAELGLVHMLYGEISYDFVIRSEVLYDTVWVFGIIFVFLLLKGLFALWRLNAVNLLMSENTGEKPPKANYLIGIAGIVILGIAYYIALSIQTPLLALSWFMIAVILVIVATYMLFIAGSVMLCRVLQKSKKYYYHKNHFVAVSSMTYRMKRNGAGLASICILSTMVLVMMLGAGSLYCGAEDSLKTRYPREITVAVDYVSYEEGKAYSEEKEEILLEKVQEVLDSHGVQAMNEELFLCSGVVGMVEGDKLYVNPEVVDNANVNTIENVAQIYLIPLDRYNDCMDTNETLNEGEVLIYCVRRSYENPQICLSDGTVLTVKKQVEEMIGSGDAAMNIIPSLFLVVNNMEKISEIFNEELQDQEYFCRPCVQYGFDVDLKAEEQITLACEIRDTVRDMDIAGTGGFYTYSVECREENRADFYGTYGGLFYLGIILSIVFILATVLIIYYKQVTEGYEDESRFGIMQKVGMTKKDIRKSINSQILIVFFLPLVTAVLHLSFAFPMVQKLLALFNFRNLSLMILVLMTVVFVFGVFYGIVYKVTSNVYFAIVSGKR